ncbi:MAG: DUF5675 family protein [Cyclobacteriaceae bacterium]
MKRLLLLVVVAIGTLVIVALYKNPDLLDKVWLWAIGLAGAFIQFFREFFKYIGSFFKGDDDKEEKVVKPAIAPKKALAGISGKKTPDSGVAPAKTAAEAATEEPPAQSVQAATADVTINLLRYTDDGETTVGLLYLNDRFYCYTLEDTYHNEKVPGETRIPAGDYTVNFRKQVTPLTEKYRTRYPSWFTFHIEIENVPGFTGIYIHSGGTSKDTEGCILVSDSLSIGDTQTFLTNSRNTFKSLYGFLSTKLDTNQKILIKIRDEGWATALAS